MLITRQADYAVRVVIFLANFRDKGLIPAKEIAERAGIPKSFLPGIISVLAKRKILYTEKGKGGGIRLARDPEKISVFDVIEAVDGAPQISVCTERPDACSFVKICRMHRVWKEIQDFIHEKLKKTKISDVMISFK